MVGWLVCNAAGGLSLSDRGGSGEGEGDKKEAHSLRKVRGHRHLWLDLRGCRNYGPGALDSKVAATTVCLWMLRSGVCNARIRWEVSMLVHNTKDGIVNALRRHADTRCVGHDVSRNAVDKGALAATSCATGQGIEVQTGVPDVGNGPGLSGGRPGSVTVRCRGPPSQSIPPTWNASKRRQPAWPLPLGAPRLRGVNVAIPEGTPQWSMCSTSTETRLGIAVHAPRHRGGNLQLGQCHTTLLSPCFENTGTVYQTRVRQRSTRPVRPRHRCGQWSLPRPLIRQSRQPGPSVATCYLM